MQRPVHVPPICGGIGRPSHAYFRSFLISSMKCSFLRKDGGVAEGNLDVLGVSARNVSYRTS